MTSERLSWSVEETARSAPAVYFLRACFQNSWCASKLIKVAVRAAIGLVLCFCRIMR